MPPSTKVRLAGNSATAKSGGGVTVTVIAMLEVKLPDMPVIVICDAFATALVAVLIVIVLEPVVEAGLKAAVTPAGNPVTLNATVPVNPVCGTTLTVAAALPPIPTLIFATEEDSLKLGGGAIVNDNDAVAEMLPDVAVITAVLVATVAEELAVSFKLVLVPDVAGLNEPVTPAGRPVIANDAEPVNPF